MTVRPSTIRDRRSLAVAIRLARKRRGWTQRDLAGACGVVTHHISRLETGVSDVKLSTLLAVVSALGQDLCLVPRGARPVVTDAEEPSGGDDLGIEEAF